MIDFDELTALGLKLLGDPLDPTLSPIRSNFYGTSIRIQSTHSGIDAHVKANPKHFSNEALLLHHFHDRGLGQRIPQLLACSPEGDIVVTQTCGEPMRELFKNKTQSSLPQKPIQLYLADALLALVEVQSGAQHGALLEARSAYFPTSKLPELILKLAGDGLQDSLLTPEDLRILSSVTPQWISWAEELARLECGDFWDHGDFGSGNVLLSKGEPHRAILIDLSESAIMCPCFSASQFLFRLQGHLGIATHGPEASLLREGWATQAAHLLGLPYDRLQRGLDLCFNLHLLYGLLISQRFAKAYYLHTGLKFQNPNIQALHESFTGNASSL